MRPALFAILSATIMTAACSRPPTSAMPAIAPPIFPKVDDEPTPPHATELKNAIESFHEALVSGNPAEQKKALATIQCRERDISTMFPKHERFWGVIAFGLHGLDEDLQRIGGETARHGRIKSIRFVDLRRTGGESWIAKVDEKIPIYRAVIAYDSTTVRFDPLLYVNGRWVWFPNLETIAAVLPAEGKS